MVDSRLVRVVMEVTGESQVTAHMLHCAMTGPQNLETRARLILAAEEVQLTIPNLQQLDYVYDSD